MAYYHFERLLWVGLGAQDALRLATQQVARAEHGNRVAIKRLWRQLDVESADLE